MFEITSFSDTHLEDAAALVCNRYRQLRNHEPLLPARYTDVSEILPRLRSILAATDHCVVAIRGGRLVGFLTGWLLPSFRGKRSAFSPEWANAAELGDSQFVYEEMYSQLAADWVADKYIAHYISIFPDDGQALRAWNWMGFGMTAVDAIRSLETIPSNHLDVEVRLADVQDLEEVMEFDDALWQHIRGTPDFLIMERKERSHYEKWLADPRKTIWLAKYNEELVAFMSLGPANEDVCTIIVDEKTTSIYEAFTKVNVRGRGIATTLLNHALESASDSGYERCAVDFEPMNLAGTRFWLKHFRPVCFSLFRYIDERLVEF